MNCNEKYKFFTAVDMTCLHLLPKKTIGAGKIGVTGTITRQQYSFVVPFSLSLIISLVTYDSFWSFYAFFYHSCAAFNCKL